jgi:hypothetical protein
VAADHDVAVGVFLRCRLQHGAECGVGRPAIQDRGVALGLVNDKDVAGVGGWQRRVVDVVFGQIQILEPGYFKVCSIQEVRILQIVRGKDILDPRWAAAVEVRADRVDKQAKRRLTRAAGMQRPQEGILHPDQGN